MTLSSATVHRELPKKCGEASKYPCVHCGAPAQAWSYQYNGDPELYDKKTGAPYSEDLYNCYAPACARCHKKYDIALDPRLSSLYQQLGKKQAEFLAELRASDPEFAEKMRVVGRRLAIFKANLVETNPAFAQRMHEIAVANGKTMVQRHRERMGSDPEYRQKVSADRARAASVANQIRRRCDECPKIAHPAAIGAHQKASGHSGYTDL